MGGKHHPIMGGKHRAAIDTFWAGERLCMCRRCRHAWTNQARTPGRTRRARRTGKGAGSPPAALHARTSSSLAQDRRRPVRTLSSSARSLQEAVVRDGLRLGEAVSSSGSARASDSAWAWAEARFFPLSTKTRRTLTMRCSMSFTAIPVRWSRSAADGRWMLSCGSAPGSACTPKGG